MNLGKTSIQSIALHIIWHYFSFLGICQSNRYKVISYSWLNLNFLIINEFVHHFPYILSFWTLISINFLYVFLSIFCFLFEPSCCFAGVPYIYWWCVGCTHCTYPFCLLLITVLKVLLWKFSPPYKS
jgi:hypothetical protein